MSLIGSIGGIQNSVLSRLPGMGRAEGVSSPLAPKIAVPNQPAGTTPANFSSVFEQMVEGVHQKQLDAQAATREVLLGQTDQLHTSVIAMQEAGVAFQLMVEVRNKLVDSYQELMRMPV